MINKIFIFLGNYIKELEYTRHNLGFIIYNNIVNKLGTKCNKCKKILFNKTLFYEFISLCNCIKIKLNIVSDNKQLTNQIILFRNYELINQTGQSFLKFINDNKNKLFINRNMQIFLIYDDASMTFGKFRIKDKSKSSTHNGIRNLYKLFNSNKFIHLKFGVGNIYDDLEHFVLSKFSKQELNIINKFSKVFLNEIIYDICSTKNIDIIQLKIKFNKTWRE